MAVEAALIHRLPAPELRHSAAEFLCDEATALADVRPDTARALREIADAVS